MPARTRKGHSAATTTEEPVEEQPAKPAQPETQTGSRKETRKSTDGSGSLQRLKFNEPITWRVGRAAIPIADLLQRLQNLAQELRKFEQEEVDARSLTKVSQELAAPQLLAHKDKGVRAWVGCCVVDVLRLCAPDAPFTGNQLKVGDDSCRGWERWREREREREFADWSGIGYLYVYCVVDYSRSG